jgi:SAM-dependent methyltransferase
VSRVQYDSGYFKVLDAAERASAAAIVPLVIALLQPESVCDVGCARGGWLAVFKENGVGRVLGIDGDYVERDQLKIDESEFRAADLEQGLPDVGRFDLAVSLEVAEHLAAESAGRLVDGLVALAPAVLFSAAVPGQGGRGHVNEQWPEYWRDLFARHDYVPIDCIRARVWHRPEVNAWYKQNTLLFAARPLLDSRERLREAHERSAGLPLALVHPLLFKSALERPWNLFRELAADVEAGRLTHEELEKRLARMLERFAARAREREHAPREGRGS